MRLERAFGWLEEMRGAGLSPNAVTWSALINACCRAAQIERAFQVLAEMESSGFTPNVVTYTTLSEHRPLCLAHPLKVSSVPSPIEGISIGGQQSELHSIVCSCI